MEKIIAQESVVIGDRTFDALLFENQEGRFLTVSARQENSRSEITIPHTGLCLFSDALQRIIQCEGNKDKT